MIINSLTRFLPCYRHSTHFFNIRTFSTASSLHFDVLSNEFTVDENYFRNEINQKQILDNIRLRELKEHYPKLFRNDLSADELSNELIASVKQLPNSIHPIW